MEAIIVAGLQLLSDVYKAIQEARTAAAEKHDAILARLQAAQEVLAAASDEAHSTLIELEHALNPFEEPTKP